MSETTPKTCPECGSANVSNDGIDYYWGCDDCGADWPEEFDEGSEEDA